MAIKTLHMTNAFHSESGGVRVFYLNLLRTAERRRRAIRLLVPAERSYVEDVGEFGRIYYVKAPRAAWFDRRYRQIYPHTFLIPGMKSIWPVLHREQPDLIDIADKYTLSYLSSVLRWGAVSIHAPGNKRPTVVTTSCERMDDNVAAFIGPRGRFWARLYMRKIYGNQFDFFLANSDYTADEIRAALPAWKLDRVHVRPCGVDNSVFQPMPDESSRNALLKRCGGDDRSCLILYAGRLSPEKNIGMLPDVSCELRKRSKTDFRWLIAGSGPMRDDLARRFDGDVGSRVTFLGQVSSHREMAQLYSNCDVFVHPNPREPFGIAPLEAMACGAPVVAPRAGGVLSYLNDENSWLAEPTASSFADAIATLISSPACTKEKVEAARQTARQHDWDCVADSWFALYDRLHAQRLESIAWARSFGPSGVMAIPRGWA